MSACIKDNVIDYVESYKKSCKTSVTVSVDCNILIYKYLSMRDADRCFASSHFSPAK